MKSPEKINEEIDAHMTGIGFRRVEPPLAVVPGSVAWPDIGNDPLKVGDMELQTAIARLTKGVVLQQTEVPDQTMLAWRIDVSRVLGELTMMTARWEISQGKRKPQNGESSGGGQRQ